MKTKSILILCTAFLVSVPCADAQSFIEGLKSIGGKIGKQIVKKTQAGKSQTTGNKPTTNKPAAQKALTEVEKPIISSIRVLDRHKIRPIVDRITQK